jgi:large subunit ribosomal protein L23
VRTDATKADIKAAVEFMFDVKVRAVQVVNQQGKEKRFGRFEGRRSDWKKAYVRLVEGARRSISPAATRPDAPRTGRQDDGTQKA